MNTLITGASRGIGLELCHQALQSGHRVLAVARKASHSEGLKKLHRDFPELQIVDADLTQPKDLQRLLPQLKTWGSLDLLINNAGILKGEGAGIQGVSPEDLKECFEVNVVAPIEMTKLCLPYLEKSKAPRVANLTSLMGSLSDNKSGGYYAYRISKSALNMFAKSFSVDHPKISCVVLHPGWVKTDMGGPQAPLSAEESGAGLWKFVQSMGTTHTGRFFDYRGRELPW